MPAARVSSRTWWPTSGMPRALAGTPGFVAVSVTTLATAIGTATALFTAANGFFYRPLPVPGGTDLVAVFTSDYEGRSRRGASSYADILDFAKEAAPVAELAGHARVMLGVGVNDDMVLAQGSIVSPGYFRMLRVTPAMGRIPYAASPEFPTIVLSFSLWRRTFGSDTTLVGRQVRVNGQSFTAVAVAPPGFRGTSREIADDFWIDGAFAPLVMPGENFMQSRGARRFHVLARLHDGTLEALNARLGVVAFRLFQDDPQAWRDTTGHGRAVTAMRERDAHIANIPRGSVVFVVGGVMALGLGLLAIASTNLASLQLARGAARRREIATRLALGAGRGRVIRQLLAECALVVVPGTIAGVIVSIAVSALVSHYRPIPLPSIDLALDWRTLGFIAGGLLLTLLVFGLMPALQTVRSDLVSDLKGVNQTGTGGIRLGGLRGGLIIAQVALSVVFTAAAGMVAFALARDAALGRGEARNVLIAQVNFLPAAGDSQRVRALTDALIADIAAIPGVGSVSAADFIPVRGRRRTVAAELRGAGGETRRLVLDANGVQPGYFDVVGRSMLRGRDFEPGDARVVDPAVIVSRAMADALWPSGEPIGQRITVDARGRSSSAEVVGVVADPVGQGPATAESFPGVLFVPMLPGAEAELVLHVRVPEAQSATAGQVMQRLRDESLRLVSPEVMTLDRYYERVVFPQRLIANASGVLAIMQLLLAVAGLSGLVAYVTALRRREVGIRVALGASRRSVLGLVMRQGIRLTAIGGAIGVTLSLVVSRVVALSLPVTMPVVLSALLVAAVIFSVTGAIAMWLPARRSLDVAPAAALRAD